MPELNLSIQTPFPTRVDWSMVSEFDSCETKYRYRYQHNISPTETSPHLHAGGAFAAGIETTRRALWIDKLDLDSALCLGTHAFTKFWGNYEPPERYQQKNYANTLGALWDYFREYPPDTDPVKPYLYADGTPAIEFTFAIPTEILHPNTGEPIIFCGRFDMLGYYNNLIAIIDEKTAMQLGAAWVRQWEMRGQFIGYTYVARKYGIDVKMVLIRGIGLLKTKYTYLEAIEQYPNYLLDRWWKALNLKISRMISCWQQNEWQLSFGAACESYGGCDYKPLCTAKNPSQWLSEFEYSHWDPLHKGN